MKATKVNLDFTRWKTSWSGSGSSKDSKEKYDVTNWWYKTSEADVEYLPAIEQRNPSVSTFLKQNQWPRLTAMDRKALKMAHRCQAQHQPNGVIMTYFDTSLTNVQLCHGLNAVKKVVSMDFNRLFVAGLLAASVSFFFS